MIMQIISKLGYSSLGDYRMGISIDGFELVIFQREGHDDGRLTIAG